MPSPFGKSKMLNRITMTCSGCLYTASSDIPAQKRHLAMRDYNARLATDLFYVHIYILPFFTLLLTHVLLHTFSTSYMKLSCSLAGTKIWHMKIKLLTTKITQVTVCICACMGYTHMYTCMTNCPN